MSELEEYLEFAKGLAEDAGKIMLKYFRTDSLQTNIKDDLTPVTLADTEVNSMVISRVKEKYPGHGVLGEEESINLDSKQLWIVDPLDGTGNFAGGIPQFAFSIALVSDGAAQIAVVYDPIPKRLLQAIKDKGAYENGRKLDISNNSLKDSLVISSWVVGGIENSVFKDKAVHAKFADSYAQRGSIDVKDFPIAYALAIVAADSLDGVVSSIKTPWDVAAGSLIAEEAGAKVTDLFGNAVKAWDKDANGILAASPKLHAQLLEIIKPALKDSK